MESTQRLSFKVARKEPELIAPAKPTPHEFKVLSDIDLQEFIRFQMPTIHLYPSGSAKGKDPVKVIRDGIGKALVFYYPFAGRVREWPGGKLAVECTGEGALFIEADADVTLQQLEDAGLYPPFPCKEELLYDVPASSGMLHSPLLLIQVTRLKCGGFIFAIRFNHLMCDAAGLVLFLSAVGEVCRGAESPSVPPTWDRHLLRHARGDDSITIPETTRITPAPEEMAHRSFFFGAAELSSLRSGLPLRLRDCSTFDLLTACLWRCRTIAIATDPQEQVKLLFPYNCRKRIEPPLPEGYYGNVFGLGFAVATVDELSRNPLHRAVELVRKSKMEIMRELEKPSSLCQLTARGQQRLMEAGSYTVSDVSRHGFEAVDLGWGKSVYSGLIENNFFTGIYIPCKNNTGRMVSICLPPKAMDVFVKELHLLFKSGDQHNLFIRSPL